MVLGYTYWCYLNSLYEVTGYFGHLLYQMPQQNIFLQLFARIDTRYLSGLLYKMYLIPVLFLGTMFLSAVPVDTLFLSAVLVGTFVIGYSLVLL